LIVISVSIIYSVLNTKLCFRHQLLILNRLTVVDIITSYTKREIRGGVRGPRTLFWKSFRTLLAGERGPEKAYALYDRDNVDNREFRNIQHYFGNLSTIRSSLLYYIRFIFLLLSYYTLVFRYDFCSRMIHRLQVLFVQPGPSRGTEIVRSYRWDGCCQDSRVSRSVGKRIYAKFFIIGKNMFS
jgi:hypothetical protein